MREEKLALIAQFRGSGLTQRAFAEREGIKFSTFTAGLQGRRLARRGGSRKARVAAVPALSMAPVLVGLAEEQPDGVVVHGTSTGEVAALVLALKDGPLSH